MFGDSSSMSVIHQLKRIADELEKMNLYTKELMEYKK